MKLLLAVLALPVLLPAVGAVFTHIYARRTEKRYPPTGRFIEIDGCRLHYREAGPERAPRGTIVILHGASSNLVESMVGLGFSLAERYRVIAFDRPGHGWSERRPGLDGADPARQAAAIAEALRRLHVSDAVIVGHSWSGAVVPNFGLDHTDVAGALFIISGLTHPWPGGQIGWYKRLVNSRLGWLLTRTFTTPATLLLRGVFERKTFSPQAAPPGFFHQAFIPLAFRPKAYYANLQDFAVMYDAVAQQSPRYGGIRLPAVVIGGDRDEIVWTDLHSRSFARDVASAELVIVPGVGHMPHYARRDLFLEKIEALAERIVPARVETDQA